MYYLPAFAIRNVARTYRTPDGLVPGLRHAHLDIPAGRLTAVTGPSGGGKSTLLRILGGLDRPDQGEVYAFGRPVPYRAPAALQEYLRTRSAFVFQEVNLIAALTAAENVAFPRILRGWAWRDAVAAAEAELARFGLAGQARRRPAELSQGQRQRVGVAKALFAGTPVLLADEPTSALDQKNVGVVVGELLRVVRATGRTVVLVTHDPVVLARADHVLLCRDGVVSDVPLARPADPDPVPDETDTYTFAD